MAGMNRVRARRAGRGFVAAAAALAVFLVIYWPSLHLHWIVVRECYRLAEALGIMSPAGPLGGQVAGFNFQREPAWVHRVATLTAAMVTLAVPMTASLLVLVRAGVGPAAWRRTYCGACGSALKGLAAPACPECRRPF